MNISNGNISNGARLSLRRECLIDFPDGSTAIITACPDDFANIYYATLKVRGAIDSAAAVFIMDIERHIHGDPEELIKRSNILQSGMTKQHADIFFDAMESIREDWGSKNSDYGANFIHLSRNKSPLK